MTARVVPLALAVALAVSGFGALLAGSANAGGAQPLGFALTADGVTAQRLPHYITGRPLDVTVDTGAVRADRVVFAATAADGTVVERALVADPGGRFRGTVDLPQRGAWNVALTSGLADQTTTSRPLPIEVSGDDVRVVAMLLFLLAGLAVAGGVAILAATTRS